MRPYTIYIASIVGKIQRAAIEYLRAKSLILPGKLLTREGLWWGGRYVLEAGDHARPGIDGSERPLWRQLNRIRPLLDSNLDAPQGARAFGRAAPRAAVLPCCHAAIKHLLIPSYSATIPGASACMNDCEAFALPQFAPAILTTAEANLGSSPPPCSDRERRRQRRDRRRRHRALQEAPKNAARWSAPATWASQARQRNPQTLACRNPSTPPRSGATAPSDASVPEALPARCAAADCRRFRTDSSGRRDHSAPSARDAADRDPCGGKPR